MGEGRLAGKVAMVTGAARGQGRSHAVRLAEEGADIIAFDLCGQVESVPYAMAVPEDLQETAALVEKQDRRIVVAQGDVRDRAALFAAADRGVAELGRLDVVVANAGIVSFGKASDMPEQTWRDMIDINLTGVWNTIQATLPHIRAGGRGGSIIMTSSTAGLRASANIAHYAAAKHGLQGIMKSLAHELGPESIRINTVHPTTVSTDMVRNPAMFQLFRPDIDGPSEADALPAFHTQNLLPIPWVEPVDISNGVVYLASDEGRYITATELTIDAGAVWR
jgi:(+)-trans-carveol dehydrogenase